MAETMNNNNISGSVAEDSEALTELGKTASALDDALQLRFVFKLSVSVFRHY